MKKTLRLLPLLALAALPLQAQQWSLGVGAGPFVFGDFVQRSFLIKTEDGASTVRTTLTAKTRPGLTVDLGRDFQENGWLGIRLRGTFVDAPIALTNGGGDGVGLDAGHIDVATISAPLVIHLNRNGSFRFHLLGGPAFAAYHVRRRAAGDNSVTVFRGTRERWGAIGGVGVDWMVGRRFAIEGELADVVTSSPFERIDFSSGAGGLKILRPHNVHTSVGIRYRF